MLPANTSYVPQNSQGPFLTLYRLKVDLPETSRGQRGSPEYLVSDTVLSSNVAYFKTPREFINFQPPTKEDNESQLLFLRGFPSAHWIKLIGSKYYIDPEYFYRHLDFGSSDDRTNTFCLPGLPSSSWHLMHLPVTSIGLKDSVKSRSTQEDIDGLRDDGAKSLARFHEKILRLELNTGDTLIRQFYNLDEMHCAVEQRISICMKESGKTFIGMLLYPSINLPYRH